MAPTLEMFRMITAYWTSQAIGVAARLGIADELRNGPRASDEIARAVKAHPDAVYRLLRLLAMNGIFTEVAPRTFALTPLAETLRSDSPASMRPMAVMQTARGHWLPWGRLLDAVRTGRPVVRDALDMEIYEYYAAHPDEAAFFNAAMNSLSALASSELLRVYDFSKVHTIADVGGGHGGVLAAILKAHPTMRGILFDLPPVIATARDFLTAQGVVDRCSLVAGDFFEAVPEGADLHLLKHVVHNWSDEQATRLLTHCKNALPKGGKLLILEFLIPPENRPSGAQPMDVNMMVHGDGRERTEGEFAHLFEAACLRLERVIPTQSPFSVIEAARA